MLQPKPDSCRRCPFYEMPGPVHGRGPVPAKLAVIAESPGKNEVIWCRVCNTTATIQCIKDLHRIGSPLVGGSGRIFDSLCRNASVPPDEVYRTNVVRCLPPDTGNEEEEKIPEEAISACHHFLVDEMQQVQPDTLILMGNYALRQVSGESITKWQGSVVIDIPTDLVAKKAVPILHTAGISRSASKHGGNQKMAYALTSMFIAKAAELSRRPGKIALLENFIIYPKVDFVEEWLSDIWYRQAALDIECSREDSLDKANVICIGVYDPRRDQGLCIPLLKRGGDPYWDDGDERRVVRAICLAAPRVRWTVQNGPFDFGVLETAGFPRFNYEYDTLYADLALNPELGHRLHQLGARYTNHPYWKDEAKGHGSFINTPDERLRIYNLRDARQTWLIRLGQELDLKSETVELSA